MDEITTSIEAINRPLSWYNVIKNILCTVERINLQKGLLNIELVQSI